MKGGNSYYTLNCFITRYYTQSAVKVPDVHACRTLPAPRSELYGRRGHAIGRGLSQHSLGPACQGRGEPSPSKRATISVRRAGSEERRNMSVESAEEVARASPRSLV